jgi:hypothetical protein
VRQPRSQEERFNTAHLISLSEDVEGILVGQGKLEPEFWPPDRGLDYVEVLTQPATQTRLMGFATILYVAEVPFTAVGIMSPHRNQPILRVLCWQRVIENYEWVASFRLYVPRWVPTALHHYLATPGVRESFQMIDYMERVHVA